MSFLDAVKEVLNVAVEAVKENPVVAAGCVVGAVAVGGGIVYLRKRNGAQKKVEAAQAQLLENVKVAAGLTNLDKQ